MADVGGFSAAWGGFTELTHDLDRARVAILTHHLALREVRGRGSLLDNCTSNEPCIYHEAVHRGASPWEGDKIARALIVSLDFSAGRRWPGCFPAAWRAVCRANPRHAPGHLWAQACTGLGRVLFTRARVRGGHAGLFSLESPYAAGSKMVIDSHFGAAIQGVAAVARQGPKVTLGSDATQGSTRLELGESPMRDTIRRPIRSERVPQMLGHAAPGPVRCHILFGPVLACGGHGASRARGFDGTKAHGGQSRDWRLGSLGPTNALAGGAPCPEEISVRRERRPCLGEGKDREAGLGLGGGVVSRHGARRACSFKRDPAGSPTRTDTGGAFRHQPKAAQSNSSMTWTGTRPGHRPWRFQEVSAPDLGTTCGRTENWYES